MNIAVIGANGRSGVEFIKAALSRGHIVTAGAYRGPVHIKHKNLRVVLCDATKPAELRKLLKGQQAVVSLLGHVPESDQNVQTRAITNAVNIMTELGLRRIVSLTGTGVRFTGDRISLADRALNAGVSLVDPARVRDGRAHVEVLRASGLDWTVVRVLKLTNGKPNDFRLSLHGPAKVMTPRSEVAMAIVQILEEDIFVKKAPIIGRA